MKKKYSAANSRRFKRLKADYLVKYKIPGFPGDPYVSNIKDISAGGLRFWSDKGLPEKSLVQISVLLPPMDREIKALGRLVRVRPARRGFFDYVAVSFIELSQDDQNAINDFIEHISVTEAAHDLIDQFDVVKRKVQLFNV
jgi:c-di-GMP-binding flagellar brake protein YcgR